MYFRLGKCVLIALATLSGSQVATAGELLINGNLETFAGASPTGWTYIAGDGSYITADNSPFTNFYPVGTKSLQFTDNLNTTGNTTPSLNQIFPSATGLVQFSFDFKFGKVVGDPWEVALRGPTGGAVRFDFTSSLNFIDGSPTAPISLGTGGVWNQMTAIFDLNAGTYSGSVYNSYDNTTRTWTNRIFSASQLNSLTFSDTNSSASNHDNGFFYVDNFSVQMVPEPSTFVYLALVSLAFAAFRVRKLVQAS